MYYQKKRDISTTKPNTCKQLQEKNVLTMANFLLIQENYVLNYKNVHSLNEEKPISTLTLAGCSQLERLSSLSSNLSRL